MQIKTAMRYRLTPVRMLLSERQDSKRWQGHGKREAHVHCWWVWELVAATVENS